MALGRFHGIANIDLGRQMIVAGDQGNDFGRIAILDAVNVVDQAARDALRIVVVGQFPVMFEGEIIRIVGGLREVERAK